MRPAPFRWRAASVVFGVLLALGACQPAPETAHVAVEPHTAPVRTITSFNEALRCMDDLFLAQGKKDVYITSAGIPDATGQVAAGTKEMLITAIAKMSAKSGAFHFVDFDPTQIDVQMLSELVGLRAGFVAPNYYIRGAITQLDSNVLSSTTSVGISAPMLSLAASRGQVVSVMSVDLNVGQLVTRQIVPGMSASNSIAVVSSGQGGNIGGVIGQTGLAFNVEFDRSEGIHQAVRDLIELSAIESMGKLTRVPYWQCLEIDPTNPTYRAKARELFDAMSPDERARFVRTNLARTGYLNGAAGSDELDPTLRDAIARYQSEHDLVANGRIDFDLYYRLSAASSSAARPVAQEAAPPPAPPAPASMTAQAAPVTAAAAHPPSAGPSPSLQLSTSHGAHPTFRVNDTLVLQAQTGGDGFLYCYYQDAEGAVARIFPNRFQPNALVHKGTPVEIPPASGKPFVIRFAKSHAKEAVACVVSSAELGLRLPHQLKAEDLEPLPVHELGDIIAAFRQLGGSEITEGWLPIEVM